RLTAWAARPDSPVCPVLSSVGSRGESGVARSSSAARSSHASVPVAVLARTTGPLWPPDDDHLRPCSSNHHNSEEHRDVHHAGSTCTRPYARTRTAGATFAPVGGAVRSQPLAVPGRARPGSRIAALAPRAAGGGCSVATAAR